MPANWTTPVTWNTGQLVTAANLNEQLRDNLEYLKQSGYAILTDQKAQNVGGGTMAGAAWTTRDLQTEVVDSSNIVALGTNQFTPITGLYRIAVSAPHFTVVTGFVVRLRVQNINAGTTVLKSGNFAAFSADPVTNLRSGLTASLHGVFSANGTDAFAIQYYSTAIGYTSGSLGSAVNESGASEIYTTVLLEKLS